MVAEEEGFKPPVRTKPYSGFRVRPIRSLWHSSFFGRKGNAFLFTVPLLGNYFFGFSSFSYLWIEKSRVGLSNFIRDDVCGNLRVRHSTPHGLLHHDARGNLHARHIRFHTHRIRHVPRSIHIRLLGAC